MTAQARPSIAEMIHIARNDGATLGSIAKGVGLRRHSVEQWQLGPIAGTVPARENVPALAKTLKRPTKEVALARIEDLLVREDHRHQSVLEQLERERAEIQRRAGRE